ncbi:MAG: hypothetical protein JXL80_00095 [Planctomycetes bacterium]|nr:hypothetical protein [Planctomycetota bacterium]
MLQCNECEFADIGPQGQVRLKCNPFTNIKEPECLQKWQLMKLEALGQAYAAQLMQYRRLAPLQEKMMKFMEREMDDIDESDKWKTEWEGDEEETSEDGPGEEPFA